MIIRDLNGDATAAHIHDANFELQTDDRYWYLWILPIPYVIKWLITGNVAN